MSRTQFIVALIGFAILTVLWGSSDLSILAVTIGGALSGFLWGWFVQEVIR
ncbi:MAG: hypothetical protein ACFB2W_00915 [Leptolyngbyaceae cyanobacterium]